MCFFLLMFYIIADFVLGEVYSWYNWKQFTWASNNIFAHDKNPHRLMGHLKRIDNHIISWSSTRVLYDLNQSEILVCANYRNDCNHSSADVIPASLIKPEVRLEFSSTSIRRGVWSNIFIIHIILARLFENIRTQIRSRLRNVYFSWNIPTQFINMY